jgi:IS5 family transposase
LKQRGIHFAGKPLGRPKPVTDANREQIKQAKAQRRQDDLQRIPMEGKFGQGKHGYRLNYIRAKRANTSFAWINTIFLVMNLLILERIFFALSKCRLAGLMRAFVLGWEQMVLTLRAQFNPAVRFVHAIC